MRENVLLKLTEDQKLTRFTKVAFAFQKVAQKQLELLKNHEQNNQQNLHPGFMYFIRTLEGFWENFDFLFSLRRGKNRKMAHYPARSMFESLLRLEHYVKQKREGQNHITDIEILRIYKRLYDDMVSKKEDPKDVEKTYYDVLNSAGLGKDKSFIIDKVSEEKIDPFPSIYQLTKESKLANFKNIYFHYRILCEHSHGKMIASRMRDDNPKRAYRQMLMYGCLFARNILMVVDHHIQGATKDDVSNVLLKTDSIIHANITINDSL